MTARDLAELQSAVESLVQDEGDWQARVTAALDGQFERIRAVFEAQTAELLAILQSAAIGGAS